MIIIATLFRKLQTVKDLVRPLFQKHRFRKLFGSHMLKGPKLLQNLHERTFIKSRFRRPLNSQHVKGSQTLVKSE